MLATVLFEVECNEKVNPSNSTCIYATLGVAGPPEDQHLPPFSVVVMVPWPETREEAKEDSH